MDRWPNWEAAESKFYISLARELFHVAPRFRKVLNILITAGRMITHQRDTRLAHYTEFLQEQKHHLRLFEKGVNRLDEYLLH